MKQWKIFLIIENIYLIKQYQKMKKSFSPVFNDTARTSDPVPTVSFNLALNSQFNYITELKDALDTPGQFIFQSQNLQVCRRCFQWKQNAQKIIWPCKCPKPIHIRCLQDIINEHNHDIRQTCDLLKCKKCKSLYSIQVQQSWALKFDKLCRFSWFILVYYALMMGTLAGIIGLVVYYGSVSGLDMRQQNQENSNGSQTNQKGYLNDQNQKNLTQLIEQKTMVVLSIVVLLLTEIILVARFCKNHVILRKLQIIQHLQNKTKDQKQPISPNQPKASTPAQLHQISTCLQKMDPKITQSK